MYRLIITAVSAMLLFASCTAEEPEPPVPTADADEAAESEVFMHTGESEEESWFLVAEGKYLNLYYIDGGKRLKNSEQIDLSVFPDSDADELKKGIKFDTVRDAYSAMESFIN